MHVQLHPKKTNKTIKLHLSAITLQHYGALVVLFMQPCRGIPAVFPLLKIFKSL